MRSTVAKVLWCGSSLATLLVATSVLGMVVVGVSSFRPAPPLPLEQVFQEVTRGNPYAIAQLGILSLLGTPLARLLTAAVVFLADGERKYALMAFLVFTVIIGSILFASR